MGIHVSANFQNRKIEARACLTSGCVRYYETEQDIYVYIEDTQKNGIKVEKSVTLKKRENYDELISDISNGRLTAFWDEPRADEGEMLETLKYFAEKLKRGMKYVGMKLEYTSPRGLTVYFRLRYSEEGERPYMNVDLVAEKEGEKLTYRAYGYVNDYRSLLEEAARAIAAYVLFANFISSQQAGQSGESANSS